MGGGGRYIGSLIGSIGVVFWSISRRNSSSLADMRGDGGFFFLLYSGLVWACSVSPLVLCLCSGRIGAVLVMCSWYYVWCILCLRALVVCASHLARVSGVVGRRLSVWFSSPLGDLATW